MSETAAEPIIALSKVSMAYAKPSGEPLPVLSDIDVSLRSAEILGLLGRSGAGKSTLLRIIAGLIKPTAGDVLYRGAPLTGPAEGIAVVFQSFALFPWLTVLQNVEAGLDALGLQRDEARKRAQSVIDLIGLDGFQAAYPRELSGGMRQRVGFARAFVIQPLLLLMDEPFSALDVLTAETLRTDFIDLWIENQLPTKSVLLVTHNIEEAVFMCDRVLVMSSNPGRIAAEIRVDLPHPRDRISEPFRDVVDELYCILTSRTLASITAQRTIHGGIGQALPHATVNQMSGLVASLVAPPHDGSAELAEIARTHIFEVDDLFPIAEALHILEFAELNGDQLKLTAAGRVLARCSDTDGRKKLFGEHLLKFVPLVAHIRRVLDERAGHIAPRARFEIELEDHLTLPEAETTLRAAIAWGRYAELFIYDDRKRIFAMAPAL
jgi:NitT/TauT family transport system ATP-binding protein